MYGLALSTLLCFRDDSLEVPDRRLIVFEAPCNAIMEWSQFKRFLVDSPPLVQSCHGYGE